MLKKEDYELLKKNESTLETNISYFFLKLDYFIMKSQDESYCMDERMFAFEKALYLAKSKEQRDQIKQNMKKEDVLFFIEKCDEYSPILDMELQKSYLDNKTFKQAMDSHYNRLISIFDKKEGWNNLAKLNFFSTYIKDSLSLIYLTDIQFENVLFKYLELHEENLKESSYFSNYFWNLILALLGNERIDYLDEENKKYFIANKERLFLILEKKEFFKALKSTKIHKKETDDFFCKKKYFVFLESMAEEKRLKKLTARMLQSTFKELALLINNSYNSNMEDFKKLFLIFARINRVQEFRTALLKGALNNLCVMLPKDESELEKFTAVISLEDLKNLNIEGRIGNRFKTRVSETKVKNTDSLHPMDFFKLVKSKNYENLTKVSEFIKENESNIINTSTGRITEHGWDLLDLNFVH